MAHILTECTELSDLRQNLGLQETLKLILADDPTTDDLVICFVCESGLIRDSEHKLSQVQEEASPDMFSDSSSQLHSNISVAPNCQPVKQNSDLSFEESFNDSSDMFSDFSAELESVIVDEQKQSGSSEGCPWRGVSLAELRGNSIFPQLPPVKSSRSHAVLCQVASDSPQSSLPSRSDAWDNDHVRMPFSSQSLYPVTANGGKTNLQCRWDLVKRALNKNITTSLQLETAILSYNTKYTNRWDFKGLHSFFSEVLEPPEVRCFFNELLPSIIQLALQLPILVNHPIPLLRQHMNHSISLSQLQIASLLANALLCTFPRRNTAKQGSEYASFPDINFNRLFAQHKRKNAEQRNSGKLKCIFHYFRRVCNKAPEGVVTFTRHYISPNFLPQWGRSTRTLTKLHVSSVGTIEDQGFGMLQVDFANKRVGGGVLGWGCVQEEIRFVICPELIISRLFTESLDATESLLITGCERFSNYTGYADNFEWAGDHSDNTPRDSSGRRLCSVVAIDATALRYPSIQFQPQNLRRELDKAYVGFQNCDIPTEQLAPVATGNWGCGAYRGNPRLKALLQLMAAAHAGRHLAYFTFGDKILRDDIFSMYSFLQEHQVTVGQLWNILCLYYDQCFRNGKWSQELYPFIKQEISPSSPTLKSKGLDKQKLFSPKEDISKAKDTKSPKKRNSSPTSLDRPSTAPPFSKKDSQLSCASQKPSRKEPLSVGRKKDLELSNDIQQTSQKEPLNIGKKEESFLLNASKKLTNTEQNVTKKYENNLPDDNQEASSNEPSSESKSHVTSIKETSNDLPRQQNSATKSDTRAPSRSGGSLLESLEHYDNINSCPPKRRISDYFSVINVPK
ncbi:poly(ADP-ribose) glycohydrolase isoform X2 [Anabrus simplex]|uniref:poly(ADP-ribose) glycohydrolase isoform X2 n=1 Tax=Anabrus simplex TaxID=316456 RepID=UPI0035A2A79A